MNIYRINIEEEKEIKMSNKYVYVFNYSQFDYNKKPCPFCKMPFYSVICSPAKRYYWKKWFKKLYCSISGYHKHYSCKNCLTHWIVMLETPDNPIGYLPG